MRCLTLAALALLIMASDHHAHSASAYITQGLPPTTHRAILRKMTTDVCRTPLGDLKPETLDTVVPDLMSAWGTMSNPYHVPTSYHHHHRPHSSSAGEGSMECVLAAEDLLKRIVDERRAGNVNAVPTTESYNAILYGWAHSGLGIPAALRAEQILREMHAMHASGEGEGDVAVRPDTESFRSAIYAWARAAAAGNDADDGQRRDSAQRAQRLLAWMVRLSRSGDNDSKVNPDTNCFNIVLKAIASSGLDSAPEKTEELLVLMDVLNKEGNEAVRPNARSFNEVLTAWSRCSDKVDGAAERAEDVLNHMEFLDEEMGCQGEGNNNADVRPTFASYSTVVAAWAKRGGSLGAKKADGVLRRVEGRYKGGDSTLRPDTVVYNIVNDAYVKAKAKDSYKHARDVLTRQLAMHDNSEGGGGGGVQRCRPDVYSFTLVLNACASTFGSRKDRLKAFDVAEETFHEMSRTGYAPPNHVSYGTMLKACVKLLPYGSARRDAVVRDVFVRCCRNGCVGDMVLNKLEEAATPALFDELMGGVDEIPHDWTQNVPPPRRKQKYFAARARQRRRRRF